MKKYCFALDLKDDAQLISEYEKIHENIWPEIKTSIVESGITDMQILRTGNRLVMIMETVDDFSFEKKAMADAGNPLVQKWETYMWTFQQAIPSAKADEKWVLMTPIFELNK